MSGVQIWCEDIDCPSQALGLLGWEKRWQGFGGVGKMWGQP